MSGGSYDYFYLRLQECAASIRNADIPHRSAFVKHLYLVADAMQAIEWVDSGDYSEGEENKYIEFCLGENAKSVVLSEVLTEAKAMIEKLNKSIEECEKAK